jgi:toluene monooxygenase electron transfer component
MKVTVQTRGGAREFESLPGEKILRAALRQGVELAYDCATGTCGTCKAQLVVGRTENAWPEAPGVRNCKAGEILTCQSIALENCALEVDRLTPAEAGPPRPASLKGTLRDPRPLTHDVISFDVELEAWLDFAAGQFVLLETPHIDGARAYSIVGSDHGGGRLTLVAKRRSGGRFGEWLFGGGADGAPLTVFGPLGRAVFVRSVQKHLLCLAGGTGIAGMLSILRRAAEYGHFARFDAHLFFGVRAERDTFCLEELTTIRARHPERITVTVALSDEDAPRSLLAAHPALEFVRGLVHEVAGKRMAGRFSDLRAYVAGPRPMVDASVRLLLQVGRLPPQEICRDRFD